MNNCNISKDTYKVICNAFSCQRYATEKIDVNAGKFGKIPLNLCKDCVKIFTAQEMINNELFVEKE